MIPSENCVLHQAQKQTSDLRPRKNEMMRQAIVVTLFWPWASIVSDLNCRSISHNSLISFKSYLVGFGIKFTLSGWFLSLYRVNEAYKIPPCGIGHLLFQVIVKKNTLYTGMMYMVHKF